MNLFAIISDILCYLGLNNHRHVVVSLHHRILIRLGITQIWAMIILKLLCQLSLHNLFLVVITQRAVKVIGGVRRFKHFVSLSDLLLEVKNVIVQLVPNKRVIIRRLPLGDLLSDLQFLGIEDFLQLLNFVLKLSFALSQLFDDIILLFVFFDLRLQLVDILLEDVVLVFDLHDTLITFALSLPLHLLDFILLNLKLGDHVV